MERLNTHLAELQAWRRRVLSSKQKIDGIVRTIDGFQGQRTSNFEEVISLKEDWTYLSTSLSQYSKMLENMLPVLTSFAQIVDARRSFAETANISRLTILALVFVPLSFLASLFSMNTDYGPGGDLFWVYFVVAVPITVGVYFIARPLAMDWSQVLNLVQRYWRRERRWEGEEGAEVGRVYAETRTT